MRVRPSWDGHGTIFSCSPDLVCGNLGALPPTSGSTASSTPEGLKNREMLSYYSTPPATQSRDQLHVSTAALGEDDPDLKLAYAGRLWSRSRPASGSRTSGASPTPTRRRLVPRAGAPARRAAGAVLFQCPPNLELGPRAHQIVRRLPAALAARRDGVSSSLLEPGPRAAGGTGIAWCVAETVDDVPAPTPSRGSRLDSSVCERPSTPTKSLRWAERIGPRLAEGRDVSATSSMKISGPVHRWRSDSKTSCAHS